MRLSDNKPNLHFQPKPTTTIHQDNSSPNNSSMSANIDHLMQNVYNYFLDLYHQNSGTSTNTTFLSFDAAGPNITPNMFKLHISDTDYSAALAVEQFSDLTNVIPEIDADNFRHTSKHIDEFYDVLLEGSFPASQDSNEITLFSTFKSQARKKFDDLKIGSCIPGKILQFHPAYATPNDWYDTSTQANWTSYSASMSDQQQSGETPPIISLPLELKQRWQWQVLPESLTPVLQDSAVLERISTLHMADLDQDVVRPHVSPALSKAVLSEAARPELENRLSDVLKVNMTTVVGQRLVAQNLSPTMQKSIQAMAMSSSVLNQAMELGLLEEAAIASNPAVPVTETRPLDQIMKNTDAIAVGLEPSSTSVEALSIRSPVVQAVRLQELLKETTEYSVVSSSLSLSFNYCMVMIDRPWLSQAYLATQGWYVPGYSSGSFSTGAVNDNFGIFPALPITFILAKDLQISGWSDEESETVERSAGFGPFSLIDRTVNRQSKTLTKSGMQIIGWICQTMPLLPPSAAPST